MGEIPIFTSKPQTDILIMLYRPVQNTKIKLPIFAGGVAAGFPSPAEDYKENKIDLNEELIQHPSSTFMIRAKGDSMIGAGIFDDDLLVVDRSLTPVHGSIIIAAIYAGFTVKRLQIEQSRYGQQMILAAENPDYDDTVVDDEEATIWGVVSHVVRDVRE